MKDHIKIPLPSRKRDKKLFVILIFQNGIILQELAPLQQNSKLEGCCDVIGPAPQSLLISLNCKIVLSKNLQIFNTLKDFILY